MDFLFHWPPGPVVATVQCQGLTGNLYLSWPKLHRCQPSCNRVEIRHFGLFPAFLPERPAFLALFRITTIAENLNNFKLYGDILFEKALRKRECLRHDLLKLVLISTIR